MAEPPGHREYAKIVAKVWAKPEFYQRLLANPVEVLRNEGIDVPERTKVVDLSTEAPADFYLVLYPKPASLDKEIVELYSTRIDEARARACCEPPAFCTNIGFEIIGDLTKVVATEKTLKAQTKEGSDEG